MEKYPGCFLDPGAGIICVVVRAVQELLGFGAYAESLSAVLALFVPVLPGQR